MITQDRRQQLLDLVDKDGFPKKEAKVFDAAGNLILDKVVIIKDLIKRSHYTPDFSELNQREWIPVFVYCALQREMIDNQMLKGAKYLGWGKTTSPDYAMRGRDFPVAFSTGKKKDSTKGHLRGEVFAVSPDMMLELDYYKGNGQVHDRHQRSIVLLNQKVPNNGQVHNLTQSCHLWLGNHDYWDAFHLPLMPVYTNAGNLNTKYFKFDGPKVTPPVVAPYPQVNPHHLRGQLFDPDQDRDYMMMQYGYSVSEMSHMVH